MNNKVKVTADQNGNVIVINENKPEYGYIRVEQETVQINGGGWLNISKRSAFINGKVEDLLKADYKNGQEIFGKIVIMESLVPFNPTNPDKNLKLAGTSGVICRVDDQPIYRQAFYTGNPNAYDELIMHTNSEEIKDVIFAQKEMQHLDIKEKEATL